MTIALEAGAPRRRDNPQARREWDADPENRQKVMEALQEKRDMKSIKQEVGELAEDVAALKQVIGDLKKQVEEFSFGDLDYGNQKIKIGPAQIRGLIGMALQGIDGDFSGAMFEGRQVSIADAETIGKLLSGGGVSVAPVTNAQ